MHARTTYIRLYITHTGAPGQKIRIQARATPAVAGSGTMFFPFYFFFLAARASVAGASGICSGICFLEKQSVVL